MFKEESELTIELIKELLHFSFNKCDVTILEGIFNSVRYEALFTFAKKLFGEKIDAYYYDLSFEETVNRHLTKENVTFGVEDLKKWYKAKDYLVEFDEVVIEASDTIEENLALLNRNLLDEL